jgi:hypothetical protein
MIANEPVDRIGTIAPEAFLERYKSTGTPVILEELSHSWPARERWDLDYFKAVAGNAKVPLYDSQPSRGYKTQHSAAASMRLAEYLDHLAAGEHDLRMFFCNLFAQVPKLTDDFEYPDIGLKLFKRLPVLFMGGKGARVQMHFDIDRPDILLCHFGGRKRVLLVAPEYTPHMYRVPYSFSSLAAVDFENPDYQKYPALKHVKGELAEINHGDVLYIPPGYWHLVMYDEISFSMALRAFPRDLKNLAQLVNNLVVLRTVEMTMRKLIGQPWNDRNERLAVQRARV